MNNLHQIPLKFNNCHTLTPLTISWAYTLNPHHSWFQMGSYISLLFLVSETPSSTRNLEPAEIQKELLGNFCYRGLKKDFWNRNTMSFWKEQFPWVLTAQNLCHIAQWVPWSPLKINSNLMDSVSKMRPNILDIHVCCLGEVIMAEQKIGKLITCS